MAQAWDGSHQTGRDSLEGTGRKGSEKVRQKTGKGWKNDNRKIREEWHKNEGEGKDRNGREEEREKWDRKKGRRNEKGGKGREGTGNNFKV